MNLGNSMENLFLQPETKCDYYIDVNRKKLWFIQLELLKKLQEVCNKYGIKCIAAGGTLLGAVRHDGFIPWDDDLDVVLTRSDFNKLCDIADKEFEEPYFFQTCLTDRAYFLGFGRLRDSRTTAIVTGLDQHKYNNGVFIDINVYDALPVKSFDYKVLIRKLDIYKHVLNNYYYLNTSVSNPLVRLAFSIFMRIVRKHNSYEKLYCKYVSLCESYSNTDYEYLGFLTAPMFLHYRIRKGDELKLISHKFEYVDILIPENYDSVLKASYGDYLTFPPVENRGKWHEGVIKFDPEKSYVDYYREHKELYEQALFEIDHNVQLK